MTDEVGIAKKMTKETVDEYLSIARGTVYGNTQVDTEMKPFLEFLLTRPHKNFLEIGTCYGYCYYLFSNLFTGKKLSVDLNLVLYSGYTKREEQRYRKLLFGDNPGFITGDSHHPDTLKAVCERLEGDKLDLLFIDGDHTYEGVKLDFEMYSPLVKSGGMIAFHDIKQPPRYDLEDCRVSFLWEELKDQYKYVEFKDKYVDWGGIGGLIVP